MQKLQFIQNMFLSIIILLLVSCGNDEEINHGDPANLIVEITVADERSGKITIQASAENATEFQLRLGSDGEPVETNTTGYFEYSFQQSGDYTLDIRAYGVSGRYVRDIIPVNILMGSDVVTVDDGYFSPLSYDGYTLVWNDEFSDNTISNDWVFETGTGCPNLCGWGNNELQFYRRENAWVEDDGVLVIEARRENHQGSLYTSARMKTQGTQSFKYGRIDIRALLPKGQGIWPALWMLGDNITTVGWPACGEIDIMEMIGGRGRENTTHGTLHWDNNGHNYTGGSHTLSSGTFADAFHVFSIIWDENQIRWYMNDIHFHTINITPGHMTEFHEEFFFLFNVAVGGSWPGNPDTNTVFPQQMKVDYIRVFQKN